MQNTEIKPVQPADKAWISQLLTEHWASTKMVSKGCLHAADELPGFLAVQDEKPLGLVTYNVDGDECEIVTINSLAEGLGIGTELLKAVIAEAAAKGCKRVWLVTSNDNLNAIRFYQTRGFVLAALHRNAIEKSRELKPEIPSHGIDNIPIRDEIELEMLLR